MAKKRYTFVINDEDVLNSYGFRVLTSGIQTKQYKNNPLVLWMHKRPKRWEGNDKDRESFPIGLAYNVRTNPENKAQKLADIEFYDKNDFAKEVEQMVEDGIIRMCSMGIDPISVSDEPKYLMPGQSRSTVTKCELFEISVADIGSNPNALKLYNSQFDVVELSAGGENDVIPLLSKPTDNSKKTNTMNFEQQIAMLLGMNPDTSAQSIYQELSKKLKLADEAEGLQTKLSDLQTKYDTLQDAEVTKLVNANLDKKFKADKKEDMLQLGKTMGAEYLGRHLDSMPSISGRPADGIKLDRNGEEIQDLGDEEPKDWKELSAKGYNAVADYRKKQPQKYVQLYKDNYGREPDMSDLK